MEKENIFQGKLVCLRTPEPEDGAIHFQMDSDYTNMARASYEIYFPQSAVQTDNWAKRVAEQSVDKHEYRLKIEAVATGELVGAINTNQCDPRHGTFRYGLAIFPPFHRQGYASEAIILLLRYFFMELRYQKCLQLQHSVNRFAQEIGFRSGRSTQAHDLHSG